MRKDVRHLNTWWYRFLKVIFLFFYSISILSVGLVAYLVHRPYVQNDYAVQCNYGTKITFIAYKDKGLFISSASINANGTVGHVSEETRQGLENACGITDDDISKILNSMWGQLSTGKTISANPLWTVHPVSYVVGSTIKALEAAFIAIAILTIIFEVICRSFFYIVTGSFFPFGRRTYSMKSLFFIKHKK